MNSTYVKLTVIGRKDHIEDFFRYAKGDSPHDIDPCQFLPEPKRVLEVIDWCEKVKKLKG